MTTPTNGNYKRRDYRCPSCGRLWFRAYFPLGVILEIRCTKCNAFYIIGKDKDGLYVREDNHHRARKIAAVIAT